MRLDAILAIQHSAILKLCCYGQATPTSWKGGGEGAVAPVGTRSRKFTSLIICQGANQASTVVDPKPLLHGSVGMRHKTLSEMLDFVRMTSC
jgi:hypothetical protein